MNEKKENRYNEIKIHNRRIKEILERIKELEKEK